MDFLFSSKKKEKLVAVFDIGSGSVGGALVKIPLDRKGLPTIIKSTRTDIATKENIDFDSFLKDMSLALGFSSRAIYNSRLGAPDEIVCVLASPWYMSETRLIRTSKDHSFIFTRTIVDELLNKELNSLKQDYKEKYGEVDSAPEVIEHPIVGVSLNGYRVDDPIGKRTKAVEMNMVISVSPKICLDKIKEVLSKSFHHTPVSFSSFMISYFLSIRDRYMNQDSYLLMDIGGEVTDVGIVSKGVIRDSLSFPYGKKNLYRDICKKMDLELRDAYELFSLYNSKNLSEKKVNKLNPVIENIKSNWIKSFKDSIDALPRTLTLPEIMFVSLDKDMKEFFIELIRNDESIKSMISRKDITIIPVDGPEFLTMCKVENSSCDPFLLISSIGAMRRIELSQ